MRSSHHLKETEDSMLLTVKIAIRYLKTDPVFVLFHSNPLAFKNEHFWLISWKAGGESKLISQMHDLAEAAAKQFPSVSLIYFLTLLMRRKFASHKVCVLLTFWRRKEEDTQIWKIPWKYVLNKTIKKRAPLIVPLCFSTATVLFLLLISFARKNCFAASNVHN